MNRTHTVTTLTATSLLALAALAGPINPVVGPVAPSMKTLNEVEPRTAINGANTPGDTDSLFKITQSGSYYLTGNITGVSGKSGIKVDALDVTIDLNGFNVIGVAGSIDGVHAYPASRVTVKNGSVSFWDQKGVYIGAGGVVKDVAVYHCGTGIVTTQDCRVEHSTVVGSTFGGGIVVSQYSVVSDCVSSSNVGAGIVTNGGARVSRCVAAENTTNGVSAEEGTTVDGCTCSDNHADGIQGTDNCTVTGNTCIGNWDDGIQIGNTCVAQRNSCSGNGPAASGAGVYIYGVGSTVEDNAVMGNHYGMLVNTVNAANLIVKNRARGNTFNYNVSAGNHFASPYSDPNSAGVTPLSNFAY